MGPRGASTFVVFGFGPIGAGLFIQEALRSGSFSRVVACEVVPHVVEALREAGGFFQLNIAHADRVESVTLGPVEAEDPAVERDRGRLVQAVAEASEIATAVPSTRFYRSESPGSIHRILAEGLAARGGKPAIIYAAENHNRAAEILEEAVLGEVPAETRETVRRSARFLNTVIGKMSAVIADPARVREAGLRTLTPRDPRAFLVESFRRILISRARFPQGELRRGIEVFEEKEDLLPFEEAKLHGHNAAHALAAYLASLRDLVRLEELRRIPGAVELVRAALLEESGTALIRKWAGADPLFTEAGFRSHAEDLIGRMLNPHLGDLVERVARDPERKLGWEDRLAGTIRLALSQGVRPWRFALGAAAAVASLEPRTLAGGADPETILERLWAPSSPDPAEKAHALALVREAWPGLRRWVESGGIPAR